MINVNSGWFFFWVVLGGGVVHLCLVCLAIETRHLPVNFKRKEKQLLKSGINVKRLKKATKFYSWQRFKFS